MSGTYKQFAFHFRSNPLSSFVAALLVAMLGIICFFLYHFDVAMPRSMLAHNEAHHLELQKKLLLNRVQTAIDDLRFVSRIEAVGSGPRIGLRNQMRELCKPGDGYQRISGWYIDSNELISTSCSGHQHTANAQDLFGFFDPVVDGRNGVELIRLVLPAGAGEAETETSDGFKNEDDHADRHGSDHGGSSQYSDDIDKQYLRILWPIVNTEGEVASVWTLDLSLTSLFRRSGIDGKYSTKIMLLHSVSELLDTFQPTEQQELYYQRAWKNMNGHGAYQNHVGMFIYDALLVTDPIDQSQIDAFKMVAYIPQAKLNQSVYSFFIHLSYVVVGYLLLIVALYFYTRMMLDEKQSIVQELQKKQAFLDSIFNSSADAMITVDLEGNILEYNSRTNQLFKCGDEALREQSIERLIPSAYQVADIDCKQLYQALVGAEQPFTSEELIAIRWSGAEFSVEVTFCVLKENLRPSLLLIVREITERKVAEQELDRLKLQYFQQEKMAQIGLLVAGILHEVGNPLAAIQGLLDEIVEQDRSLESPCLTDHYRNNLNTVLQQTERIRFISHEISGFSSPKQNERGLLDLNGIVASAAHLLQYDRRWRFVRLILELDSQLPAIEGVTDQLTQVIMNLLVNASDSFSHEPDSDPQVLVRTKSLAAGVLVLEIVDNGSGISDKGMIHIFDPFYTTKPKGKGTGLGLSICEKLIIEHDGAMEIDSSPGEGTTVRIYFTYKPIIFG